MSWKMTALSVKVYSYYSGSGTFQRKQQRAQRDTGVEDVLVNEE